MIGKRVLSALCAAVLAAGAAGASVIAVKSFGSNGAPAAFESTGAVTATGSGFEKALDNGTFELWAEFATGAFYVVDNRSGERWFSNPEHADEDYASGYDLQLLKSRVLIFADVYMEEGANGVRTRFADFAANCSTAYKLTDDALYFVFDFQKAQIRLPVKLSLTDKGFAIEVLNAEAEEYGLNRLAQVTLLPAFGAGNGDDDGYILLPDGSGAVINFNNDKPAADKVELKVYGFDAGTSDRTASTLDQYKRTKTLSEAVGLPLWGYAKNGGGFVGYITSGAAKSTLYAQAGGQGSGYNMAYAGYTFRDGGGVRMLTKGFNQASVGIAEYAPDLSRNFRVDYAFLAQGRDNLADMAEVARGFLGPADRLENGADLPFYLDLYGYVVKRKPVAGFQADTVIVTTAFDDANTILKRLNDAGVSNIRVKYNFWQKDGYFGKLITNPAPEAKLGGEKGLAELRQTIEGMGGKLYLTHEPLNAYKTGGGFVEMFDALKNAARTTQKQYVFSLANAAVDTRYEPWDLVRPQRLENFFTKFLLNFTEKHYGNLALDSIGDTLYSELCKGGVNRDDALNIMAGVIGSAGGELMLNGAFGYAAAQAAHVINTPPRSSGLDVYDYDAPFYQMVFRGFVNLGLPAANLSSSPSENVLNALSYGCSPMFSFAARNLDEIIGSRTDWLFSADYALWLDKAADDYAAVNAVLKDVSGEPITFFKRDGDLTIMEYGGKLRVICNFGGKDAAFGGLNVPAKGYVVTEGGGD